MILALLLGFSLLGLLCIGGSLWFLYRSLSAPSRSWRDSATQLALITALSSGLVVVAYLVRVSFWLDGSATDGAVIGIQTFLRWGHWGFRIALITVFTALLARSRERILSLLSAVLFGSFWLIGYTVFY